MKTSGVLLLKEFELGELQWFFLREREFERLLVFYFFGRISSNLEGTWCFVFENILKNLESSSGFILELFLTSGSRDSFWISGEKRRKIQHQPVPPKFSFFQNFKNRKEFGFVRRSPCFGFERILRLLDILFSEEIGRNLDNPWSSVFRRIWKILEES